MKPVRLRPGDIIISTPPKSGTTWTQGIVRSILWPADDAPGTRSELSRWPDFRLHPVDGMAAEVEAQTHRRFLKSHAPGSALPWSSEVRYIAVYRNPADALVSWGNHRSAMRPEIMAALNESAAGDGVAALPDTFDGDYEVLIEEWLCTLVAMRESARRPQGTSAFIGGADAFFYRGGIGRGAELLSTPLLERIERLGADVLSPDAHRWLVSSSGSGSLK